MTDDDAPRSRGFSLAPACLPALEAALGEDRVFATAQLGEESFAVVHDADDPDAWCVIVRVDGLDPLASTVVSRHQCWGQEPGCASWALAELVDQRPHDVPVQGPDRVTVPTLLMTCENGIEVLYRSPDGVALTTELFDDPGDLVHDDDRWRSFEDAVRSLTHEA